MTGSDKPIEVRISDLHAGLVEKLVKINVQVVGEQIQKALDIEVESECKRCGHITDRGWKNHGLNILFKEVSSKDLNKQNETREFWELINKTIHNPRRSMLVPFSCESCETRGPFETTTKKAVDYNILYVRDLLNQDVKFEERAYQSRKVHLINCRLPRAKKVSITGVVKIEPKSKDLIILSDSIEPVKDEVTNFSINENDKKNFEKYFGNAENISHQIAPDMVGRQLAQEVVMLQLHSLTEIPDIFGKSIRGSLDVLVFGDTTTNKTEMGRDVTETHYNFGELVDCGSAKRTGITYTIDPDRKIIIWGVLPLNDLGFVVLDNLDALHGDELGETREAQRTQRIKVRKMVSGDALARVRILGIFNPGKKERPAMGQYFTKVEAIKDTYLFSNPAHIPRWDLAIPFCAGDVDKGELANARPKKRPIPDEVFVKHIYWAWSRKLEHVIYEPLAHAKIITESERMMNDYALSSLPIVHDGYREVIHRCSVAYAALKHSTDEGHIEVIVKEKHVEMAVELLEKVIEALELGDYKKVQDGGYSLTHEEFVEITCYLEKRHFEILNLLIKGPKSSSDLADDLGISTKTVKRDYEELKEYNLVDLKPGKGARLTSKGINFLKILKKKSEDYEKTLRDIGTKDVPKLGGKNTLGTRNVPMSPMVSEERIGTSGVKNSDQIEVKEEIVYDQEERLNLILDIVGTFDKEYGNAKEEEIIKYAKGKGIDPSQVEHDLEYLQKEAMIYQPKEGVFKLV